MLNNCGAEICATWSRQGKRETIVRPASWKSRMLQCYILPQKRKLQGELTLSLDAIEQAWRTRVARCSVIGHHSNRQYTDRDLPNLVANQSVTRRNFQLAKKNSTDRRCFVFRGRPSKHQTKYNPNSDSNLRSAGSSSRVSDEAIPTLSKPKMSNHLHRGDIGTSKQPR